MAAAIVVARFVAEAVVPRAGNYWGSFAAGLVFAVAVWGVLWIAVVRPAARRELAKRGGS